MSGRCKVLGGRGERFHGYSRVPFRVSLASSGLAPAVSPDSRTTDETPETPAQIRAGASSR